MGVLLYIYDEDAASRRAIEAALTVRDLGDVCRVCDYAQASGHDDVAGLWIGKAEDAGLQNLNVPPDRLLTRPVRLGKILDYTAKILRKEAENTAETHIICARFRIEVQNLFLYDQKTGKKLRLTEKEHHILQILLKNAGKSVEKRHLLDEVWGYNEDIETHTLETHIYRLRQKIEDDPAQPALLLTDVQGGYRLAD